MEELKVVAVRRRPPSRMAGHLQRVRLRCRVRNAMPLMKEVKPSMMINREKVASAMKKADVRTYGELARRMGCSRKNIHIILSRGSCTAVLLSMMAAALGVESREIAAATNREGIS